MWGADGQSVYYVSEHFGTPANIVRQDAAGKIGPGADHLPQGRRRPPARISGNGEWIVYECGADLWVVCTKDGIRRASSPSRSTPTTSPTPSSTVTFTNGATEFALSPDEKHVAFVVHGEIFLMPIDGRQGDAPDRHTRLRSRHRLGAGRHRRSSSSPTATATRTSTLWSRTTPSTRSWSRPTSSRSSS